MNDITLMNFLVWLSAGGSVIAFSWIMEQSDWFQSLTSKNKVYVIFSGSIAMALAALAVITYVPLEVLVGLEPWFKAVVAVYAAVFASQIAHRVDPARDL